MLERLAKRLLPESLRPGARSLRWWVKYLYAALSWRAEYSLRGARFALKDRWHRLRPPAVADLRFDRPANPDVSVVIPVHGAYRFTARCLRSIASAVVDSSYEVVVVDDSSPDATAELLAGVEGLRLIAHRGDRGFVHACNAGAREARGRYVVFLNNDTTVQDRWLDRLRRTFEQFSDAGAVGAKLIFADGRLQEAGGIVWRDGSAWNYGRFMKPEAPRFNYARRVDYCSGACLMLPSDLFERLGGFDVEFAPGYYEDTDLCFRVRKAGFRVYYQAAVSIVHYEGATAGRETTSGMKRHQVEHRELFFHRWRRVLREHRPSGFQPELEKERSVRRRVLIVEPRMIRPDRDSGSLRMFNLIRVLRREGYQVTFAPDNLLRPEPYVTDLQAMGVEVLYAPFVPSVEAHLRESGSRYDVVLLSRLEIARRHLGNVRRLCPDAAILFDTVDLHFLRRSREAELENDPAKREHAEWTRLEELAAADEADATIVVSEVERRLLLNENPDLDVFVVSNIHEQFDSPTEHEERSGMLFIGGFEHPPNIDAVLWLAREILPRARARGFEGTCHIVGSSPPDEIRALAAPGLRVHGFVEDISGFFETCRLSIAPLRYGAGVKGKINQSMARGLPVVGTTIACEGMGLTHGADVLISDDADGLADAVVRLDRDADLWRRLVEGGRRNIEEFYSLDAARRALRDVLAFSLARTEESESVVWSWAQAAAFLKISEEALGKMVEERSVPHLDLGGEIRFLRADLESWLPGRTVPAVDRSRDRAESLPSL